MNASELQKIMFSPQWTAKIIKNFICGSQLYSDGIEIDLIYLVLPLLFREESKEILAKSRVTSTLESLFGRGKNCSIQNISNQIYNYRTVSENGLIYLCNTDCIIFSNKLKIVKPHKEIGYDKYQKDILKWAYNLGVVFSKSKNHDIWVKVGMQ